MNIVNIMLGQFLSNLKLKFLFKKEIAKIS